MVTTKAASTELRTAEPGATLKRSLQLALTMLMTGAALFLSAGTLRWPRGWIYLGLHSFLIIASGILILRNSPALVAARGRIHRAAKHFDKVILRIYVLLLFAVPVVAGLDAVRYRWSPLPFATLYWGVPLAILATASSLWVLLVNPFAEPAVRIQMERAHVVIGTGPYLTYGPDAANVLFHVVNDRHLRKRPLIFTTNKPLNEWGKVLHDEDMAAAILDRVLERGRFIHLDGPSGRTRHFNLEEILPAAADRARISGINAPEFPEPTKVCLPAMPMLST